MQWPRPLDVLAEEEKKVLLGALEPIRFAAGACIFRAGEPGDDCYAITDGEARLEIGKDEHVDTERVLAYVTAGSLLGELSLLDELPRSASAFAETDVVAYRLSTATVKELCRTNPKIGISLL